MGELHSHKRLPETGNTCYCCLKPLSVPGAEKNVIKIKPQYLVKTEDFFEKEEEVPEYFVIHAECFEKHHLPERYKGQVKIECDKCGVFSMAKTLKDGTPISQHCGCLCHKGYKNCQYLEHHSQFDVPILKEEDGTPKGHCVECNRFDVVRETKVSFVCKKCGKAISNKK